MVKWTVWLGMAMTWSLASWEHLVQRLVSKDTTLLQVSGAQERLQQDCLATLFETLKKLATWSTLVRLLELGSGTSLQMIGKIQ